MSTVLQPFGLRAVYNVVGLTRGERFPATSYDTQTRKNYDTTATFAQGMPLGLNASGQIINAAQAAAAGSNTQIFGVFNGCEFVDTQGRLVESSWFQDSFVTTVTNPMVTFWIITDLVNTRFDIQVEAQLASPYSNVVGAEFNFSTNTGRRAQDYRTIGTESAWATCALQNTEVASGTQGQIRVLGLSRTVAYPAGSGGNNWNDAYPILEVQVANTSSQAPKPNL